MDVFMYLQHKRALTGHLLWCEWDFLHKTVPYASACQISDCVCVSGAGLEKTQRQGVEELISAMPCNFDHTSLFFILQKHTLMHRMNDSFSCLVRAQKCCDGECVVIWIIILIISNVFFVQVVSDSSEQFLFLYGPNFFLYFQETLILDAINHLTALVINKCNVNVRCICLTCKE